MSSEAVVEAALAEAERVAKKQRTCAASTAGALGALLDAAAAARAAPPGGRAAALRALAARAAAADPAAALAAATKELHGAVAALGRALDGTPLAGDAARAAREGHAFDAAALDAVEAQHLYHSGAFAAGDALVASARVPGGAAMRAPYEAAHAALAALRARDLAPALAWAERHGCAGVEFAARRLAVLGELDARGAGAALACARAHLPRLAAPERMPELQRLMGAVVCAHRRPDADAARPGAPQNGAGAGAGAASKGGGGDAMSVDGAGGGDGPYADLLSPAGRAALWAALERDFTAAAAAAAGQAVHSPLLVAVAAGGAALPTLLKLADVAAAARGAAAAAAAAAPGADGAPAPAPGRARRGAPPPPPPPPPAGADDEELPVELPLGPEFVFRSIFACPVSQEQATPQNPAMMLPCGHCMCRDTVLRLAKGPGRAFKCAYCPAEATLSGCLQLRFPDAE